MTRTIETPRTATGQEPHAARRGRIAAILALTRAETTLLLRNRTALFNSLLLRDTRNTRAMAGYASGWSNT